MMVILMRMPAMDVLDVIKFSITLAYKCVSESDMECERKVKENLRLFT